jgi:hypothetical protein
LNVTERPKDKSEAATNDVVGGGVVGGAGSVAASQVGLLKNVNNNIIRYIIHV